MSNVRVVKLDELTLIKELYPRTSVYWATSYKYADEMKAGAVFPPLLVGELNDKLILVDGWHRYHALKRLGEEYYKAEVRKYEDEQTLFTDAIKFNVTHGRALSSTDKIKIMLKLEDFGVDKAEITSLLRLTAKTYGRFEARVVKGPRGVVILKSVVSKQVERGVITRKAASDIPQRSFKSSTISDLLIQLIELIQGDAFPWNDDEILTLVSDLWTLIEDKMPGQVVENIS